MFKDVLCDPHSFCVNWELVPGRGAREKQQEQLVEQARQAVSGGKVHAIGITDNPGGSPALASEYLCAELQSLGVEPLVHFACRDKNRNELESMLYSLERCGARNLLVVTGDYPSGDGFGGTAKPVFDLDPAHVLQLIASMNRGHSFDFMGKPCSLAPASFFAGVAVSPFKATEAELTGQYAKLRNKIEAGAQFIITQIGYDMRKLHELLQWLEIEGYAIPVMANIFVLTFPAGRAMYQQRIPGCVVTQKLLAQLEQERSAEDKGREARLSRAARMYAIAQGMGCAGAHIGGHGLSCGMVERIIDEGESLAGSWEDLLADFEYPQPGGYYYFERSGASGLNERTPAPRRQQAGMSLSYLFSSLVHAVFLDPASPLFPACRRLARVIDSSKPASRVFGFFEDIVKTAIFSCMRCGDCALAETAYLCPMSQCPKGQRNGPCGGSHEGWCEVYPNTKKCVWVRAYERRSDVLGRAALPPCRWNLQHSSSWLNYYLGRDHAALTLPKNGKEAAP